MLAPVATQTTAFTPSNFDISAYAAPGSTHTISVDVKGRGALKASNGRYLVPDAAEWAEAVSKVIRFSFRDISKAAMAELAVYEQRALTLYCEKCRAQEGTRCWDMRPGFQGKHVKHPHKERMDDLAEAEAAA